MTDVVAVLGSLAQIFVRRHGDGGFSITLDFLGHQQSLDFMPGDSDAGEGIEQVLADLHRTAQEALRVWREEIGTTAQEADQ
jgi:hypothetical protein